MNQVDPGADCVPKAILMLGQEAKDSISKEFMRHTQNFFFYWLIKHIFLF